jgi:putative hydrolase of the HAD superfamily
MTASGNIDLLVWDFGGVICAYDYRIFSDRLAARIGRDGDEVFAAVFRGTLQAEFELGRLSGPEYHRLLMARLGADLPYDEFFPLYGDIFREIPATTRLLDSLHGRYPLYLLSNTNAIHFGFVLPRVPALRLFRELILSYQVGAMKPDPRIFREVSRRSGLPAEACVFIDDRPEHVEGAGRCGLRAIRFQDPGQCAEALRDLGVECPAIPAEA